MTDLKLFLVYRDDEIDYDTYNSFVVCASSKEEAMNTHPDGEGTIDWEQDHCDNSLLRISRHGVWCDDVQHVNVKYLGIATGSLKKGVVCSSFNAG